MKVGIEAAHFFIPDLYLEIKDLAIERGIDSLKLEKGLGLNKMAVLNSNEDTATLAANALFRLIENYAINPNDIAKIYLGTESALDAAKPTCTYAVQMVEEQLVTKYGVHCFRNCDVLDMTFACIGGIDALQNALDFVQVHPNRKAIVIAADYAKYELGSSGEYTQGAGAVALLISSSPNLIEIESTFGIATESVFDFFKPRRYFEKSILKNAPENYPDTLEIFTDEPIFDGQYSNECFKERIKEAYYHFKSGIGTTENMLDEWQHLIFHLPYAFHGKRILTELFALEKDINIEPNEALKQLASSDLYQEFVKEKIETSQKASSEIGNMYTASIFMALLSTFQTAFDEGKAITENKVGFFAYGSGSKAKVFEGKINKNWQSVVAKWYLFQSLANRTPIDFKTYLQLHKKQITSVIHQKPNQFVLDSIEKENPNLKGARYYTYIR